MRETNIDLREGTDATDWNSSAKLNLMIFRQPRYYSPDGCRFLPLFLRQAFDTYSR